MAESSTQAPIDRYSAQVLDSLGPLVLGELLDIEAALDSPGARALLSSFKDMPDLPYARHTLSVWRDQDTEPTTASLPHFVTLDAPVQQAQELFVYENHAWAALIGREATRPKPQPGTPSASLYMREARKVLENNHLYDIFDNIDNSHLISILPVTFLRIMADALAEEVMIDLNETEKALPRHERAKLAYQLTYPKLVQMCQDIVSGEAPVSVPKNTNASIAQRVADGALAMLNNCYEAGNSAEHRQQIVVAFTMLELKIALELDDKRISSDPQLRRLLSGAQSTRGDEIISLRVTNATDSGLRRVSKQLTKFGLGDFSAETNNPEIRKASLSNALGFLDQGGSDIVRNFINAVHTRMRVRQIARTMVDGIASGEFNFSAVLQAGTRFHTAILGEHAEAHHARATAEQEAREREEARLHDLGWLTIQLKLNSENEVDVEFLPSATGTRPAQAQTETVRQQTAKEGIAKIEKHRLLTLIRLQEIYPGSIIRFRTLRNRKPSQVKVPDTNTKEEDASVVNPMEVRGHLILVLSDDRVVGESLQPGNATVVYRPESWRGTDVEVSWEEVFKYDKDHVKDFATVRIQHPDKRDLESDYAGTVESYVLLILEDLEYPLNNGETLPNLDILRNLRRALGSSAARATTKARQLD